MVQGGGGVVMACQGMFQATLCVLQGYSRVSGPVLGFADTLQNVL